MLFGTRPVKSGGFTVTSERRSIWAALGGVVLRCIASPVAVGMRPIKFQRHRVSSQKQDVYFGGKGELTMRLMCFLTLLLSAQAIHAACEVPGITTKNSQTLRPQPGIPSTPSSVSELAGGWSTAPTLPSRATWNRFPGSSRERLAVQLIQFAKAKNSQRTGKDDRVRDSHTGAHTVILLAVRPHGAAVFTGVQLPPSGSAGRTRLHAAQAPLRRGELSSGVPSGQTL
jgi:hypothetical protein